MSLISEPEVHEIRRIWRNERQDWEDSVPKIFRAVVGKDLDWLVDDQPQFDSDDRALLESICEREGVPAELAVRLLNTESQHLGMARRAKIFGELERVLAEDWRSEEEAIAQAPVGSTES